MSECIEVMEAALKMLARGEALLPLGTMMRLPHSGNLMGLMPAYLGGLQALGVKVIAPFPSNYGTEYDSHQGVVLLFDGEHGLLRAIVDGTAITAIRTAMPKVTCARITDCGPSATSESISTPRFIGPGCMTMASGRASLMRCGVTWNFAM